MVCRPRGYAGQEAVRRKKAAGKMKLKGVDPTTSDRDYQPDEVEFMFAMNRYRNQNNRPFPTWSEALRVLKSLGYRKVADPDPGPEA